MKNNTPYCILQSKQPTKSNQTNETKRNETKNKRDDLIFVPKTCQEKGTKEGKKRLLWCDSGVVVVVIVVKLLV